MKNINLSLLSNKKSVTVTEFEAMKMAEQVLISAYFAVASLKEEGLEEITDSHYSFEEAEAIRLNFYEADSMRRTKRQTTEVEVSDDFSNGESVSFEDLEEENEADEDYIYDMGGAEFYVAQQHKAAIQCGDVDRITKRSSVYEDGGDIAVTRVTGIEHGNDNMFANRVQEAHLVEKEIRYAKALAAEMKAKFDARRAKEIEMRDFAIAEYKRIAALIVDEASAVKYGEGTYVLVRAALKEKFGTEYIYKYVRYEYKGKKYPTFETCFHMMMTDKFIKSTILAVVGDKRKLAYLALKKQLDGVPARNAAHLASLIKSMHKEIGIDRSRISDALGYAWENGEFFAGPVYGALKGLAA